ncbi:UNVERIFIED_CONTAM: hypothetical protein HDU68_012634, partial [Siphonaria sp. JEL0065]
MIIKKELLYFYRLTKSPPRRLSNVKFILLLMTTKFLPDTTEESMYDEYIKLCLSQVPFKTIPRLVTITGEKLSKVKIQTGKQSSVLDFVRVCVGDGVRDDTPLFAVSHTWNNAVDWKRFGIPIFPSYTSNIFKAVSEVASAKYKSGQTKSPDFYLWLDYLCTNQRDQFEIREATMKMAWVYGTAFATIVVLEDDLGHYNPQFWSNRVWAMQEEIFLDMEIRRFEAIKSNGELCESASELEGAIKGGYVIDRLVYASQYCSMIKGRLDIRYDMTLSQVLALYLQRLIEAGDSTTNLQQKLDPVVGLLVEATVVFAEIDSQTTSTNALTISLADAIQAGHGVSSPDVIEIFESVHRPKGLEAICKVLLKKYFALLETSSDQWKKPSRLGGVDSEITEPQWDKKTEPHWDFIPYLLSKDVGTIEHELGKVLTVLENYKFPSTNDDINYIMKDTLFEIIGRMSLLLAQYDSGLVLLNSNGLWIAKSVATTHTNTNPILKITWLIVSTGYKVFKDTVEEETSFKKLAGRFAEGSAEFYRLKDLKTVGIKANVCEYLTNALNLFLECLIEVAKVYLDHSTATATTTTTTNKVVGASLRFWSTLNGSTSDKLKGINDQLDHAYKNLREVKADGTFAMVVDLVNGQASIKKTVDGLDEKLDAFVAGVGSRGGAKRDLEVVRSVVRLQHQIVLFDGIISDLNTKRHPGTRVELLKALKGSVENGAHGITWLRAVAGTGKSVISGCVANLLSTHKDWLLVSFFCLHSDDRKNSVSAMIQNLAFQIAEKNPDFCKLLRQSLDAVDFKNENTHVRDVLDCFITTPFANWNIETPIVIVIDALDELVDKSGKDVSLTLDRFQSITKMSAAVKFFVTSRPEVNTEKEIDFQKFDVNSDTNKDNIRVFTLDRLADLVNALGEDVSNLGLDPLIEKLVKRSAGLFIWITLVLGNVSPTETFHTSEDDVKKVLGDTLSASDTPAKETVDQLLKRLESSASLDLKSLYCRALWRAYPTDTLVSDFKSAIGVLLLAPVPLSTKTIGEITAKFPDTAKMIWTQVDKAFKTLQSLVKAGEDRKLSVIHKTVSEYLMDISCHSSCVGRATCKSQDCCHKQAITRFQIDFDKVSLAMAHATLTIMDQKLSQNMAIPKLDGAIKYVGQTFPGVLSESLEYAVLYWSKHSVAAFSNASITDQNQLLESLLQFCQTKLPMYLEAVLLLGQLNSVVGVANSVVDCLEALVKFNGTTAANQVSLIRGYLTDLKFIAFNFRPQLLTSPLQVYRHALIAVPHETLYYKNYSDLAPTGARLTMGHEWDWGPLTLYGHSDALRSVVLSADGKTVVSGSSDTTVKLWDVRTGECICTLKGHVRSVRAVAISMDSTVISGSTDNTIKLWDTRTGQCLRTLKGHTNRVVSVVISTKSKTIVSGSNDATVRVWDSETGACIRTLKGHTFAVRSIALSANDKTVVSGSDDNTIRVWDIETGDCIKILKGHKYPVYGVVLSGGIIVSGSNDKTVKVWDLQQGTCTRTLEDHKASVTAVAISVDGDKIVSGSNDNTVKCWDIRNHQILTLNGHTDSVTSKDPPALTVVSGSIDKTVKLWSIQARNFPETLKMKGHASTVNAIAISADGKTVVSGSSDRTVKVWNARTGECFQTLVGHTLPVTSVAISVDDKTVVSGSYDNTVKVWDTGSGHCTQDLKSHVREVNAVAISVDGKTVVSGSSDTTVKVWNARTGEFQTLESHTKSVYNVEISTDGKKIVSASKQSKYGTYKPTHAFRTTIVKIIHLSL